MESRFISDCCKSDIVTAHYKYGDDPYKDNGDLTCLVCAKCGKPCGVKVRSFYAPDNDKMMKGPIVQK